MSGQKFNYILGVKRDFGSKMKSIFFIFKGLSLAKDFLRPDSAPLKDWNKSFATPLKIMLKKLCIKDYKIIMSAIRFNYCWKRHIYTFKRVKNVGLRPLKISYTSQTVHLSK